MKCNIKIFYPFNNHLPIAYNKYLELHSNTYNINISISTFHLSSACANNIQITVDSGHIMKHFIFNHNQYYLYNVARLYVESQNT